MKFSLRGNAHLFNFYAMTNYNIKEVIVLLAIFVFTFTFSFYGVPKKEAVYEFNDYIDSGVHLIDPKGK